MMHGMVLMFLMHTWNLAKAAGVFTSKNTGTLFSTIDPNGGYYYEYDQYLHKCLLSDGSIDASLKLNINGTRFSSVAAVPDGKYLIFATGALFPSESQNNSIGVISTDSSNSAELESLRINYVQGINTHIARYDHITIFDTKVRDMKSNSYELMIGGRVHFADPATKDIFLLYYGAFHGFNKTIEITHYYIFDQGTNANSQVNDTANVIDSFSEDGVLNILEDTTTKENVIVLLKFVTENSPTDFIYQVSLVSLKRDLSAGNWANRYTDNYQAEACFHNDKIYLMLTKDSELFFEIIDPSSGTVSSRVNYDLDNNEKLYFPQMAISDRFNTLFLVYKVAKSTGASTPGDNNKMRIATYDTATLNGVNEITSFAATPFDIQILQKVNEEQIIIKGILDTGSTAEEKRFTMSMYPILNTQEFTG